MAGRIKDEDLEAVRQRADLVDLLSDYMQLKKAGKVFKGLCPFHDEKTPSFTVDPVKQLYHCFGCGEGGDIFTFLNKREGLNFTEAVERLALRYGITIHYDRGAAPKEREGKRERLYRVNEFAHEFFQQALASQAGAGARRYIDSRGFDSDTVQTFGVGYSPSRSDALYRALIQKGFTAREAVESGVCLSADGRVIDRFRGRLMFPIHDLRGHTVGFGGRALEKVEPKYLNSPETPIYEKRKNLYALDLTRREILKEGYAILVEGYTDVLGLYQGGVRNSAATLGTALTSDHFRQLARFTDRVILVFDADAAGIGASERGLDFYLEFDLDLRVASLPGGMDPADFMREKTRDDFLEVVERSMPLPEFCIRKVLDSHNLRDANTRSRAVSRCLTVIANLERKESVSLYLKIVSDLAEVDHSVLAGMLDRAASKQRPGARSTAARPAAAAGAETVKRPEGETPQAKLERQALGILLDHPVLAINFKTRLGDKELSDPLNRLLLDEVSRLAGQGAASADQVVEALQARGEARNLATSLILTKSGNTNEMSREEAQRQLDDIWIALEDLHLARQIKDLERALAELVKSADRDHRKEDELSTELFQLERQRRHLRSDS